MLFVGENVTNFFRAFRSCKNLVGPAVCGNNVINMRNCYAWSYNLAGAPACGPNVVDFLPLTDGGVFSYEVHLLKPDRAIYEEICKKYSLIPSECIFIDDRKENVEAARTFGMQAIHFKSYEDTDKELQEMLNQ